MLFYVISPYYTLPNPSLFRPIFPFLPLPLLFRLCTLLTSYQSLTIILFYRRKLLEGNKNQFFSLLTGSTVPQLLSITAKISALYGYENASKAGVTIVTEEEKENHSVR